MCCHLPPAYGRVGDASNFFSCSSSAQAASAVSGFGTSLSAGGEAEIAAVGTSLPASGDAETAAVGDMDSAAAGEARVAGAGEGSSAGLDTLSRSVLKHNTLWPTKFSSTCSALVFNSSAATCSSAFAL